MKPAHYCGRRDIPLIEVWTDNAPGERRAALVENGKIVEIHLQRDLRPILGQNGTGRIDRKTPAGAYVVDGSCREMLIRGQVNIAEGAYLAFEVTREEIAEPGRLKAAEARAIEAVSPDIDADWLWQQRLEGLAPGVQSAPKPIDDLMDLAQAGFSAADDAIVHFQRTKAGLVFDIDGTGDPFAINSAAAREIARLLRLFQIGGMVMIDFVAMESKAKRQEIAELFDFASAADGRSFERSAINGFGLMQVVRSRPRPSVLDRLFGTSIAALSDETKALWLYREAARSVGYGPRTVSTSTSVATLMLNPEWHLIRSECERQAGAAIAVIADEKCSGYGHVHVAQS
jgi:ribonuclease G